jgi:hypothetical protein
MRASIELLLEAPLPLQKGDRLQPIGEASNLKQLASDLCYVAKDLEKTDLTTFAFGMIAGTLLALVTVTLGNLSIGLGTAGGLLIVGIIIGWLGSMFSPIMAETPRLSTGLPFWYMKLRQARIQVASSLRRYSQISTPIKANTMTLRIVSMRLPIIMSAPPVAVSSERPPRAAAG